MKKNIVIHDVGAIWLPRTQTWLYSEVTQLGEKWNSWVVTHRIENLEEFPHDKVFSLESKSRLHCFIEGILKRVELIKQSISISRFVRKMRPDLIHSHFGSVGWTNVDLAKSIHAKHIVSFYGYDISYLPNRKNWRERFIKLFKEVDAVLCEAPHMGSKLEKLGCPKNKIKIYPLGIDLKKISFTKPSWHADKPLRILMAAAFIEKKGLPYALEAIGKFYAKRNDIQIEITIIGDVKPNRTEQELEKMNKAIDQYNLRKYINFKGYCDHPTLIQAATEHDVFISPSVTAENGDSEGGAPVTIIEMAAAGLPILSTTHCDIPFVLADKNRKLLVPERDSDSLLNIMLWLVDHPSAWNEIAVENRAYIEEKFDKYKQGKALAKIYNDIVK